MRLRRAWLIVIERDVETDQVRALRQQRAAADDGKRAGEFETGESEAQIRTDAGRFSRGDRDGPGLALFLEFQSLYSTYASSRRRRSHSSVSSSAFDSRSAVNARWRRTSSVVSNWRRPSNWMMCQPNCVRNG